MRMKVIDAHLHLWDVERFRYPWLNEVPAIRQTYLIENYQKAITGYDVESMVFVQCECLPQQAFDEVQFIEEQAEKDKRIKAIVAYASLERGELVKDYLVKISKHSLVKGVRRMTGGEPGLCLNTNFKNAVRLLPTHNLTLDLSIKPYQIEETIELIKECPDTIFILDHLGKPDIANNKFAEYKKRIGQFASFPNVAAKISGLITEANWRHWKQQDIEPYIAFAIEQFGFDRLMFGSDWPVVLLAGSYQKWMDCIVNITVKYTEEERSKLFYKTAQKYYQL